LLEYSDIQALNNKQENAATIAFQSAHWDSWKKLVESGIAIQHDKYKEDINNAISFVELQQTGYISPRSLSYLKSTDFLQGLLFVDNLERPLCLELVKIVDFTKPNASGLSLVNQVILIDSWQVLANVNVNLDEFDTSGRTPLITALMQGNIECAKLLLEKGL
jgi:ankyrin repeat protein